MDKPNARCATACASKQQHSYSKKSTFPILSGLLVAIIPKCPFCIMAYSSTFAMCGGSRMTGHVPPWTSYLLVGLAFLTLILILINYKGYRTLAAAGLVIAGSGLVLAEEFFTGEIAHYNLGALLLLLGVWVNGSFQYFYRKWMQPLFQKINLHTSQSKS